MEMDDTEVCYEYKTAKYKRTQIKILAELNNVHPYKICEILLKNKVLEANEQNYAGIFVVLKLYKEGLDIKEIVNILGITQRKCKDIIARFDKNLDEISSEHMDIDYLIPDFRKRTKSKTVRLEEEIDRLLARIDELETEIDILKKG